MAVNILPNNLEAETALLGSIISNPSAINDVMDLKPEDFYNTKHKTIYKVITFMFENDIAIDLVTLAEELRKIEKLGEVGGVTYLAQLLDSRAFGDNAAAYVKIIKNKSDKRKLIKAASELLEKAYSEDGEVQSIIECTEDTIFSISQGNDKSDITHVNDCIVNTLDVIENAYKSGGKITGIETGYSVLDKYLNGLQKKDLVILAARPSMGKTALALNIADNVSKHKTVAIFSLEMSKDQLTQRLLSANSLIDHLDLKRGTFADGQWIKLADGSNILSRRKMWIDDTAGMTISQIKAKCKKLKIKNGLDMVIIDYLQLIESLENSTSREQEISKISRGLKKLAKELDVVVIALSQLSRAPEQRSDHRPMLSDLRESGSIEQDADIVFMLYRDEYYNACSDDRGIAECIIAKSRNGSVGTVKLAWLPQYQRFATLETIK